MAVDEEEDREMETKIWRRFQAFLALTLREISVEPIQFAWGMSNNMVVNIYNSVQQEKVCKVGSSWFGDGNPRTSSIVMHLHVIFLKGEHIMRPFVMHWIMEKIKMPKFMFKKLQTTYPLQKHI